MRTRAERLAAALLLVLAATLGLAPRARAQSAPHLRPLVVIDAGHGGVDPGARGPAGEREKDVTLAVARRLAALLREDGHLDVRMTRDRDTLIALRDRPRLANRWRAEGGVADRPALFISIHANANHAASARGFETYFLSEAKTEDARRVAEMENAAEQYETDASPGQQDALSFILNDLRQNHYLRESAEWAEVVQRRLGASHTGPNRGVKQAGFTVLDGAFMPAVLVELGFISNPGEARMLTDAARQRQLAERLAEAVREHFGPSPPARRAAG